MKMNATAAKMQPVKGRGEPISRKSFEFEGDMIKVMLNTSYYPENLKSYPNVMRSFGDIGGATILGDVAQLGIGYMIVFAYVMLMLGRYFDMKSNKSII